MGIRVKLVQMMENEQYFFTDSVNEQIQGLEDNGFKVLSIAYASWYNAKQKSVILSALINYRKRILWIF